MIYELKEWIIRLFLDKAHFFRKLFCKECKKRYAVWVGFLDCCYEKCPKRKEGGDE